MRRCLGFLSALALGSATAGSALAAASFTYATIDADGPPKAWGKAVDPPTATSRVRVTASASSSSSRSRRPDRRTSPLRRTSPDG